MKSRHVVAAFAVVIVVASWAASGQRQVVADGANHGVSKTAPRTPDGRPDLQGYWTTQTFTPLQRPPYLAGKEFFTEEEFAALQQQLTAKGVDPQAKDAILTGDPVERARKLDQTKRVGDVHYDNAIWQGTPTPKGLSSRRTSLITDPKDGLIPPLTAEAERRRTVAAEARRQRDPAEGYETRALGERCIQWEHEGPPILPPPYNDVHQIIQRPDYIVIFPELTTNPPRVIPLDGRPHLSDKIRQYAGDSRGHWEGDTLVVETTNYKNKPGWQGGGTTEALRVLERFTRVDANRIHYVFTVDDPATWTRPWSAEVPMVKTEGPRYEYACHEGNYSLPHILSQQRNLEKQAAEARQKGSK